MQHLPQISLLHHFHENNKICAILKLKYEKLPFSKSRGKMILLIILHYLHPHVCLK